MRRLLLLLLGAIAIVCSGPRCMMCAEDSAIVADACDFGSEASNDGACSSPFAPDPASAASASASAAAPLLDEESIALRDLSECSIERIAAADLSSTRFLRDYYQRAPFILVNYSSNAGSFSDRTRVSALLRSFGSEWITAASANTFSHTKTRIRFRAYVDLIQRSPLTLANHSADTHYFFGDHDDPNQFKDTATAAATTGDSDEADKQREREANQRIEACVAAANSSNSSSVEACMDEGSDVPRSGPLWAPLLRRYQPPPFVLPHNIEAEIAAKTTASTATTETTDDDAAFSSLAGGIRRQAVSPDTARVLFDSANAEADADAEAASDSASTLPPLFDFIRYSFGLGGHRSGVPFHVHGAAIGELMHGRKRWWLVPPKTDAPAAARQRRDATQGAKFGSSSESALPFPGFRPELTQLQWLAHVYPSIPVSARPLHCLLDPGQLIYVPGNWYHATLNLGETSVFLSSFIDEGRMEGVFRSRGIDVEAIRRGAERGSEGESN